MRRCGAFSNAFTLMRPRLGVAIFARFCKNLRNYGSTTTRKTGKVNASISVQRSDGVFLLETEWLFEGL
jgi:hypothetical protein